MAKRKVVGAKGRATMKDVVARKKRKSPKKSKAPKLLGWAHKLASNLERDIVASGIRKPKSAKHKKAMKKVTKNTKKLNTRKRKK